MTFDLLLFDEVIGTIRTHSWLLSAKMLFERCNINIGSLDEE